MARIIFLTPGWIGAGCMMTGAVCGGYSFFNILRYWTSVDGVIPPLWGVTPMAFSTAVILFFYGLSFFWVGYLIRQFNVPVQRRGRLTRREAIEISLAIISLLSAITTGLIGAFKGR